MSAPPPIEHRHLRGAIEFAVAMGEEFTKRKLPVVVPRGLRAAAGKARIPTASLGALRRAIEADEQFRAAIAAGAVPELVDPIGLLWLRHPEGWEAQAQAIVAEIDAAAADADLRTALRREEKRRHAAEQVAVRLRVDLAERDATVAAQRHDIDSLRADVVKNDDELASLRAELVDVRTEARHARDRESAARAKLEALRARSAVTEAAGDPPTEPETAAPSVDPAEVALIAAAARDLAARTDALLAELARNGADHDDTSERSTSPARAERRRALALPGGVIASSAAAAEFLLRSGAVVLVDGYNVAKLAWPSDALSEQRERLLDALETVARRFGADIAVVFDGSSVVGAHSARRRQIRVAWSPEGVSADDVIRDEVGRLPTARAVVVVTNDAAIVADVKALGANVVASNALLATF